MLLDSFLLHTLNLELLVRYINILIKIFKIADK